MNMKFFKDTNGSVWSFKEDGSQDEYIKENMVPMTDEEVDRHCYPEKYYTDEQKKEAYYRLLRPLNRLQFMRTLIEYGLDDDLEAAISNIEDTKQRKILSAEYKDAPSFERRSEAVLSMAKLINVDDSKLNEMWEFALKL